MRGSYLFLAAATTSCPDTPLAFHSETCVAVSVTGIPPDRISTSGGGGGTQGTNVISSTERPPCGQLPLEALWHLQRLLPVAAGG